MQTLRPTTLAELSDALRDTTGVVCVRGNGAHEGWGAPPGRRPDVEIDMTGLDRVVEHAVGDLVVTVEAGLPLAALQAAVQPHRQWLALDPPRHGTLAGVVATGDCGPRRLRFGRPRDLLLGVTVVLADGTIARSGGKVVKNVAGYDLGKLFSGSHGTLGVIASVTLRLHPVLVARRLVSVATSLPWSLVREVLRSPATPTAIEWYDDTLHVLIESSEAAVDKQVSIVQERIGGEVSADLPNGFGVRHADNTSMLLKATFRLSALDDVLAAATDEVPAARLTAHAGSGILWASAPADATALASLRDVVAPYDGTVVVISGPEGFRRGVDVWGPVRGLDVMRRIKEQFDPDGRMNPGRFVGGI